jgi:hypothetical protein
METVEERLRVHKDELILDVVKTFRYKDHYGQVEYKEEISTFYVIEWEPINNGSFNGLIEIELICVNDNDEDYQVNINIDIKDLLLLVNR